MELYDKIVATVKSSTFDAVVVTGADNFAYMAGAAIPLLVLYPDSPVIVVWPRRGEPTVIAPEEWEETKKHPIIGKQILRCHSTLPAEGAQLVMEHHENADGSGYPEGLSLPRQHPWTRILRLLDAYDALTTFRPYRPAHPPFAALRFLQKLEGPRGPIFETRTLMNFIRFLAMA